MVGRFFARTPNLRAAAATVFAVTAVLPLLVLVLLLWRSGTVKETYAQISVLLALMLALLGFTILRGLLNRVSHLARMMVIPGAADQSAGPSNPGVMVPGLGPVSEIAQIAEAFNRMFEELRASTARLEDLVFKLGTLSDLVELTARISKIQDLLALVLERTMRAVRASTGSIMLVDRESQTLRVAAARGLADESLTRREMQVGKGVAGTVAQRGDPILSDEIEADPRLAEQDEQLYGSGSFICMPVRVGDRVIGVINLAKREYGAVKGVREPFTPTELQFLNSLMTHIAYALDNARLLEETRQAATRLENVVADQQLRLTQAQQQMIQAEKLSALGQLLAGVSHELNNPLAVVLGQAGLLRREVGNGPLAARAEMIAQAGERCARIVRTFLTLARQRPAERQEVRLNQIVQEIVELMNYQFMVGRIEVTSRLADDLPYLWGDPHQLQRLVVNLVTNAHQALAHTPAPRRLVLTTQYDPARARIFLEVADNGPGIPDENQARIFEPFFTTKPLGQGTGLGLSLCRGIAEEHGGAIRVESQPGHGTVFVVELPVEAPRRTEPADGAVPEPLANIRGKTVLVVDDEPVVAATFAEILSADGHHVDTATDGALALTKLQGTTYDLILSDIKMPGLDGPGLYREVERRYPELLRRFVFVTGDSVNSESRAFLEETGAPSVIKPFGVDEFHRVVREVLGS